MLLCMVSTLLQELDKVQKNATWYICGAKWNRSFFRWSLPYDECRSQLGWLTVQKRQRLLSCYQTFKIVNNLHCLHTDVYFRFNNSSTRSSHKFTLSIPHSRVNAHRYSFLVNISFLWNSVPNIRILGSTCLTDFNLKPK